LTFDGLPTEVQHNKSDQLFASNMDNGFDRLAAIKSIDDDTEGMATDVDFDSDPMLSSPGEAVTVGEGEPTKNPLARHPELRIVRRLQQVKNGVCWSYGEKEKHRILFKVKTKQAVKVQLHGISLYVEEMINKVIITVSAMTDNGTFGVFGTTSFSNVISDNPNSKLKTVKLFFNHPVQLPAGPKSENILLSVTLTGGSSAVGTGGAKVVFVRTRNGGSSEARKATVIFKTHSTKEGNLTTEEEGQIHSLIISIV
jgi:hypothetical protein